MREIIFRGKLLPMGGWSFGCLKIYPGGKTAIITPDDTPLGKYGLVDPATVGQYIGRTDRNGNKIFTGDIVEDDSIRMKGQVKYSEEYLQYVVDDICDGEQDYAQFIDQAEVIGNIYDNPELLEGGTENGME